MSQRDLAEVLQARLRADLRAGVGPAGPGDRGRLEVLEDHLALLEQAVAKAEALADQRRDEAEAAARQVEVLEGHIATLAEAIRTSEALADQRRCEAETAAKRVEALEAHTGALAEAIRKSQALADQRRHEAEMAAKRVEVLEAHIAVLGQAITKSEALADQRHHQAQSAAQRVDHLVAEMIEATHELIGMSKRLSEQTAAMDKLRAEFDDHRSRSREGAGEIGASLATQVISDGSTSRPPRPG